MKDIYQFNEIDFWLFPKYIFNGVNVLTDCLIGIKDKNIVFSENYLKLKDKIDLNKVIYLKDKILTPGLIDMHVNGICGIALLDELTPENFLKVHKYNFKFGVTSFLPSIVSSSFETMKLIVEAFNRAKIECYYGLIGLHFEGPYINPIKKGIHESCHIRELNNNELDWIIDNRNSISLLTVAPEILSISSIALLVKNRINLSLGHSNATYEIAKSAFDNGIMFMTHMFNAMNNISSREPGPIIALLEKKEVTPLIISDGYHIHKAHFNWLKIYLKDRFILATDSLKSSGSNLDKFYFCGEEIFVVDNSCKNKEGRLAGSNITLKDALVNWTLWTNCSWEEAIYHGSTKPAEVLGLGDKLGYLLPGYIANMVSWSEPGVVDMVWFEGDLVFD